LAARINEVFLGAFVYVEVRSGRSGEPGTIVELRHTDRGFVLEGFYGADNRRVPIDRAQHRSRVRSSRLAGWRCWPTLQENASRSSPRRGCSTSTLSRSRTTTWAGATS
jgi:hypothetical protein